MPKEKLDFQLVYLNGYLYVNGGKDAWGGVVNSTERYSLALNNWTVLKPSP